MNKILAVFLLTFVPTVLGFGAGYALRGYNAPVTTSDDATAAAPPAATPAAPTEAAAATSGCDEVARGTWTIGGAGLNLEARAFGADCSKATAVLVISDGDNPLYQTAMSTAWVFDLAAAMTPNEMTAALGEWISAAGPRTTSELPLWPPGADGPDGEFPFYPAEGFDQQAYEDMRAAGHPVFCFTQGMESMTCLRNDDGVIEDIGLQTFPG